MAIDLKDLVKDSQQTITSLCDKIVDFLSNPNSLSYSLVMIGCALLCIVLVIIGIILTVVTCRQLKKQELDAQALYTPNKAKPTRSDALSSTHTTIPMFNDNDKFDQSHWYDEYTDKQCTTTTFKPRGPRRETFV
ncbi:hypothetical protein NEHOM01_0138 [Nematocida homosporus]|uniref:uncharacterized protein n=1 Tax=Nematocida homosporus TaxID=1912981 RepID=UPI00221EA9BE|nr:uncharacterized protein NEHOM01_0138 [Nematocida homosporus]KAI5184393.1 hypothetical protein NEHOM01_0138 [Nematocida homosporus]